MNSWILRAGSALEFIFKNFATPIAFFLTFQAYGAKPAIALALVVTAVTLLIHLIFKLKISPFFMVAAGFTVVLGSIDLVVSTPRFFRLEPFAQNFLMGAVFLVTVLMKRPIAEWFAAALPASVRPELGPGSRGYLQGVTLAWSIYFFLKSFLFLYLALQVDLGRLVILRSVIGGASLAVMFGGELAYRKWFWRRK